LRFVPGWGTSVDVGRSPGAASLATWASRSISLSRWRGRPGRVGAQFVRLGTLFEVVQDPLHDRRVLSALASCVALPPASMQSDAGDDFHGAAALVTGLDVDLEYPFEALGPGYCHGWHVCRLCRSKSRSWPRGAGRGFGPRWAFACRGLPGSRGVAVRCCTRTAGIKGRTRRGIG